DWLLPESAVDAVSESSGSAAAAPVYQRERIGKPFSGLHVSILVGSRTGGGVRGRGDLAEAIPRSRDLPSADHHVRRAGHLDDADHARKLDRAAGHPVARGNSLLRRALAETRSDRAGLVLRHETIRTAVCAAAGAALARTSELARRVGHRLEISPGSGDRLAA